MADVTPVYGLPYLELADPPNLASGLENLATDVETELIRIDAKQRVFTAACSANVDLNATEVDITGASITFSTTKANAQYLCIGSFYFAMIAASNGIALGKLSVDGSVQTAFANFTGLFSTPQRENLSQTWTGTLAAAGSHTLKLRGVGNAAVAHRVNSGSTTITVLVFE